jgi:hypothetical protein
LSFLIKLPGVKQEPGNDVILEKIKEDIYWYECGFKGLWILGIRLDCLCVGRGLESMRIFGCQIFLIFLGHKSFAYGIADKFCKAVQVELLHDLASVERHGFNTDK